MFGLTNALSLWRSVWSKEEPFPESAFDYTDIIRLHTQGHRNGEADIAFGPQVFTCGDITDGVEINIPYEVDKHRGGFVVSFSDFEKAYLAAKSIREKVSRK